MYNMGKRYLSHGKHYIFVTNIKKRLNSRLHLSSAFFHALSYCCAPRVISVAA